MHFFFSKINFLIKLYTIKICDILLSFKMKYCCWEHMPKGGFVHIMMLVFEKGEAHTTYQNAEESVSQFNIWTRRVESSGGGNGYYLIS